MLVTIARFTVIGIFALCSTASIAGADIYRWVDPSGDTHFVSDLGEVPDQYREAAMAAPPENAAPTRSSDSGSAPSSSDDGGDDVVNDDSGDYDDDDGDYDGDYYGDDARARMRQTHRKAEGVRPEAEAARQVGERPAGEAPHEHPEGHPRGRR